MEEWERKFARKSERRRRKARRRRIVRRTLVIACVSIAVLAGLWLFDKLSNNIPDLRGGRVHGPRH
jgi:hypothetical protein